MTTELIANLALVAATVGSFAWAIAVAVPAAARARLQTVAEDLYAEVMDGLQDGTIPRRDAEVREFADVCAFIASHPRSFGLTESMSLHVADLQLGVAHPKLPRYDDLTEDEGEEMRRREDRLNAAMASHLIWGSRIWPVLLVASRLRRRGVAPTISRHHGQPITPRDLAVDARTGAARRPVALHHHRRDPAAA